MQTNKALTWQEDFRYALKDISSVNSFFNLELDKLDYEINIPRNLANKIKQAGHDSPLWKQFIPSQQEIDSTQSSGLEDPIGDQVHAKEGALVHRYQNRALFFPTTICPVICRYCFRKNELTQGNDIFEINFKNTLKYLSDHQEIEEIIFSGGDPLMLSNSKIDYYLEQFSKIPSIKYIRLHSRSPISMPLRIDGELIEILNKYSSIFEVLTLAIHVNHATEIDDEVRSSLEKVRSINRLKLLSQSVLLKGVNDNCDDLIDLFRSLAALGITPYYLHHPDKVKGGMHFQLDIERGRIIYANLRNRIPGWMIPTYIYDIPGGHGKQPLFNLESIDFSGKVLTKNLKIVTIPQ